MRSKSNKGKNKGSNHLQKMLVNGKRKISKVKIIL